MNRLNELLGTRVPIVQAPMAGSNGPPLAIAAARAGALGSLPCALLDPAAIVEQVEEFRRAVDAPVNLNFFCHAPAAAAEDRIARWNDRIASYVAELGVTTGSTPAGPARTPFDGERCDVVDRIRPEVVSFHFGLPEARLVDRVRATGAKVLSSATTVDEARWLVGHGCDAVIAQGWEAGGHRGMFLSTDVATQVGTFALVPQVADAVDVPVIAAGGIADGRGLAAALVLGADGVQIGTALLLCPEAATGELHRDALEHAGERETVVTNVFTGRPARAQHNRATAELGPLSDLAPPFPLAAAALAPVRMAAERTGSAAFSPLWSGQSAALIRAEPAGTLIASWLEHATELVGRDRFGI